MEEDKRQNSQEDLNQWLKRIELIDKVIEEENGSEALLQERMELTSKIRKREVKINEDIIQNSKNKWCLKGDENSALFHRNLKKKKHIRSIKGIEINGVWESDQTEVKNHFKSHFESLFKEDSECTWIQNLGDTSKINKRERIDTTKKWSSVTDILETE